jgi:diguanylate cyclase (GGDEF)-like protein
LTGLPNRTLLEDRLNQALHAASRQSTSLSLLLLDLDGFKEVNDSLGHAGGDVLLSEIGPRLRHILRESDTVARLGGDEFVVLLPSVNLADASIVAEKILATLEQPFVVEGRALYVGGSIGIVAYPEHGRDAETLLRRADSAMYAAKRDRGTYTTYIEGQDEGDAKILLAAALRRAISDAELELHYQPKVNLVTGQVGGVEALVRWHRPEHGLLLPGAFIPIAERSGLIGALGQWTLAAAAGQARQWQDAGISLTVAVNLSARNLRDPKLPDEVIRILEEHALEPRCLKLEVTESMLMIEVDRTLDALGRLKAAGVQISIDDFGTGYSSLSRLARLPVSEIKIDKSFVLDMLDNPANAVIVRSTIDLAHNLGLTVVAEGVERLDTWQRLTSWGCDEAQGFLIGKPMPNAETEEWLRRWQLHPFPA